MCRICYRNEVKPGDVIGCSGVGQISNFVNLATYGIPHWGISHVGLMARSADGRLLLFECASEDDLPCEITQTHFTGTLAHRLEDVLRVYRGKVYHYPLYRSLYADENERLTAFLMDTLHVPYDMLGALRSAGVGLSWIESLFRKQDLTTIFCSEWLAAAYAVIGLHPTDNVSRWNPNKLVRRLRRAEIVLKPQRLK